ncbi:hypothetical protein AALB51_03710 [Lachnospiraceae bacterium 62-26]|jgi:hypothetical protein|uniref:hypothetical protein n=1 Tax=Sporofaciens sp. JLR.KK001 TaxID=3112621 RepID=UPI0021727FD1|nr:hypothetical protein [Dorea sp.]
MELRKKGKYTIYWFKWIKKYLGWRQLICTHNDGHMNIGIMKRVGLSSLLSCVLLSGCTKEPVEMDVLSSHNTTSANWYELSINVIADKEAILDREACSSEIIQHVLDNDFHSVRFSYDLSGYPNEVTVDVFTSEKDFKKGEISYSFEYVTDFNTEDVDTQNNIKDNPDEFEIQYK